MRHPSTYTGRRTPVDLQLTPMIDCVFLLMVYFIWSSSFQIAEQALPSQLAPAAESGQGTVSEIPPPEADFEDIVVRIHWQGKTPSWTLNEAPLPSLAALRKSLAQVARIQRDAPVIIHPDPDVPLGHVIDVYDVSRQIGFQKVQLAASEAL